MTKVDPNNGSHETYPNLTSILIGRKILKYFNDLYNKRFSISSQN